MRYIVFAAFAILGCTQPKSTESQSPTDSIAADTAQAATEKPESKEQVAAISEPAKIPLSNEYLMEFPFSTHVDEVLFSERGEFFLSGLTGELKMKGTWKVSGDSVQITVDSTMVRYLVKNIGLDDLLLVAEDEFGAKLFRKGQFDSSSDGYTPLFRNTLSPPFPKEALHGQWSDIYGGTGFNAGGGLVHGEPDCWTEGSWKFDGEALVMKVTKSNCDIPAPRNVKVIRLSRKQLIMQQDDGFLEVWLRQGK